MTELEFINTNPTNYGIGNSNLLISSSVVDPGVDETPIPPYTIQGLTIPFDSKNSVNLFSALKEVEAIKFTFTTGQVTTQVTSRQKKNGYFFLRTNPVVVNSLPPLNSFDEYEYINSEFIFTPYFEQSFFNNDFNPLQNTSNDNSTSTTRQVVDRLSSQILPTNLQAIINLTATPAQVNDSKYTNTGLVNARYVGSVETDRNIPGNSPSLTVTSFKASIHPTDSDITTIKSIQLSDREVVEVYFDTKLSGSHPNKVFESFPSSGSFILTPENNRFTKIANAKVYSTDKNKVYTTDNFGGVILVQ